MCQHVCYGTLTQTLSNMSACLLWDSHPNTEQCVSMFAMQKQKRKGVLIILLDKSKYQHEVIADTNSFPLSLEIESNLLQVRGIT